MPESPPYDVAALGELVIDLVPGLTANGERCFIPKPGGAPGNVAVGLARLGGRAAMLTKIGDEAFGRLLLATLRANGVATEGIVASRAANTGIAIVTVDAEGDRDFLFYRNGCADETYAPDDVAEAVIRAARVLHVGSLILVNPLPAAAQAHAIATARAAGARISVDVNLRASLWPDAEAMRRAALGVVADADILKISEDELALLTGTTDIAEGITRIRTPRMAALAVTKGPAGAEVLTRQHRVAVPGFAVKVVDTVGSGDAFMAALLSGLVACDFDPSSAEALRAITVRACGAGAVAAMSAGGMESLPDAVALDAFLASHGA
ncbi:MAG TPA: carbohydrate kinase [Acetobacteraceae bacterium]|nr:carbohydrate kinase [Acetobacteraceae bacterium]